MTLTYITNKITKGMNYTSKWEKIPLYSRRKSPFLKSCLAKTPYPKKKISIYSIRSFNSSQKGRILTIIHDN